MNALSSVGLPSVYNPGGNVDGVNRAGVQRGSAVNLSQSFNADIRIVTAEGDTVTISAGATDQFSMTTYNSKGTLNVAATSSSTQELSLTVEGNLNEQELKDIQAALKTIQHATQEAFHAMAAQKREQVPVTGTLFLPARNQFRQIGPGVQEPEQSRMKAGKFFEQLRFQCLDGE